MATVEKAAKGGIKIPALSHEQLEASVRELSGASVVIVLRSSKVVVGECMGLDKDLPNHLMLKLDENALHQTYKEEVTDILPVDLFKEVEAPLNVPVQHIAPRTLKEFQGMEVKDFPWYFDKGPEREGTSENQYDDSPERFTRFKHPHFRRFYALYPEFCKDAHFVEDERRRLLAQYGNLSDEDTAQVEALKKEIRQHYKNEYEPRLFFTWVAMSQLIDQKDPDYVAIVEENGEEGAVEKLLASL